MASELETKLLQLESVRNAIAAIEAHGQSYQIMDGGAQRMLTRANLRELYAREDRLEKLTDMRDRLSAKLADPALYEPERVAEMAEWQKKFAEVAQAIDRAEALWLEAQERLEAAG